MHDPTTTDYRAERARCEVEAECVAFIMLSQAGITCDEYSLPYVAHWCRGDVAVVRDAAQRVVRTAQSVMDVAAAFSTQASAMGIAAGRTATTARI
jgi:antirestriction protein ArdC